MEEEREKNIFPFFQEDSLEVCLYLNLTAQNLILGVYQNAREQKSSLLWAIECSLKTGVLLVSEKGKMRFEGTTDSFGCNMYSKRTSMESAVSTGKGRGRICLNAVTQSATSTILGTGGTEYTMVSFPGGNVQPRRQRYSSLGVALSRLIKRRWGNL